MRSHRLFVVSTVMIGALLVAFGLFNIPKTVAAVEVLDNTKIQDLSSRLSVIAASNDVLDCATYLSNGESILPPMQDNFSIGEKIAINSLYGSEYIGGIWAPNGNSIVFMIPDGGVKVEQHDSIPSDEPDALFGVGTSTLVLYSLLDDSSKQLVIHARKPLWSPNSDAIYYFDNTDLMKYDLNADSSINTGLSVPATGASLLFSRPLADGTLLAPKTAGGVFELGDSSVPTLRDIPIKEVDQVQVAPDEKSLVIGQGANTLKGIVTPAVTILYTSSGEVLPLMQNCQYSAARLVWSPTSDQFAYPVHTSFPEVRLYDVKSHQTNILVRLESFGHIGEMSWSPDGQFLLYTELEEGSVWLVSKDGSFRERILKDGSSPSWSPDGKHILFARPDGDSYSWFISKVNKK